MADFITEVAAAIELNLGQRKVPFGMEPDKLALAWIRELQEANVEAWEIMPAMRAVCDVTDDWVPIGMLKREIRNRRPARTFSEAHEVEEDTGPPMTAEDRERFWEERKKAAEESGDIRRVQYAESILSGSRRLERGRMGGSDGRPEMRRLGDFE